VSPNTPPQHTELEIYRFILVSKHKSVSLPIQRQNIKFCKLLTLTTFLKIQQLDIVYRWLLSELNPGLVVVITTTFNQ